MCQIDFAENDGGILRSQQGRSLPRNLHLFPVALSVFLACAAQSQTAATLTDLGPTAPVPGAVDISQLSTSGDVDMPDGLNYYTDDGVNHPTIGEPGQTFTTGANLATLNSLAFKTGGGTSSGTSTSQSYVLHIYSVSGGNATLVATYGANNFAFTDGDWLQWTGLSTLLAPNSNYAFSFGRTSAGTGWDELYNASGHPYPGGEIALIPPAGGAMTLGGSHSFDSVFDLGLTVQNGPVANAPTVSPTNTPIYAGTVVTLTESATGQAPLSYQWQTDGGSGGARANISGTTASSLTITTTTLHAGNYKYDVLVSNSASVSTSAVVTLDVVAASAPILSADITPLSATAYVGNQQSFSAAFTGTLPLTFQWQVSTGAGFTNIVNATTELLTLTNLQKASAGSYKILTENSVGGPVSSSVATLTVLALPAFPTAVLANNPVGYWRLNETGHTSTGTLVAADVTHNFNGVYGSASGDDVPGPSPSLGYPGFENDNTAAEFTNNVANSYVSLPALNLNTNTVTITAWVYPIGTPASYCGIVFSRNGGDASGFCFSDAGQLGYTWNQNNQDTWSWMSGLVPPQGQWSFIALVISPQSAVTYLCDAAGEYSATNPIAHDAEAFNSPTLIGDDNADGGNGARTFNGLMDEVAIFNSSLTPSQVFNLYFGSVGGAPRLPTVSISPSNVVYAHATVVLSASVLGVQPFQYQWQENGVDVAGATNATLVYSNAQVSNSGTYDLLVSNNSGSNQSPNVVLTVLPAGGPVITQQPTPATATNYEGGLVTFTATVNGSPPLSLQWQHNGSNILNATANTLTLASLQLSEAGTYTLVASNALGDTNSEPAILTILPPPNPAALNVLTYHNDNTRQGENTNEVLLTLANVKVATFGRLITYPVDGYVYAQPLYVANLAIPGAGTHNAIFVATEHNSVYAFDADNNTGPNAGLLWQTNLGASALSDNHEFGDRYNGNNYTDIVPEVGITGTPVINLAAGTIYVDVRTREVGIATNYYHRIHALNITNGVEQAYAPVIVTNSVPGKGVDSTNGVVRFNPIQENQRPGMTLAGGMLYVAYGSFADTDPYHGWVLGFNATNLQQSAKYVFNTTPNATVAEFGGNAAEGALWMGGNGLCVDVSNNLYFETANGSFSANTNGGDYSDSFIRLSTTNGLKVADYFTPYNQLSLANSDADLGSGGPILLPDAVGSSAHPHLIVGAGKEGTIHLVDRDNMGHYNAAGDGQIVQELGGAIGSSFDTPAFFNYQIYYQGVGDVTKGFSISNGVINPTPVSEATTSFSALGGTPSISANGTNNGIVWTLQSDAFGSGGPVVLHAYNAANLSQELWNSSQNLARDNPGPAVQMTTPTVVNGKVIVPAQYAVSIFGNSLFLAAPVITPAGGPFTNSVTVHLSDASPNTTIYYTLDGTTPTTNSTAYTGPFVLTTSASVHAIAAEFGAPSSGLASAGFVDSSATGAGAGLLGNYWANTSGTAFTNAAFSALPTLTRTDAMLNFNWSGASPGTGVGATNFAARWTGCAQPEYSETYTFTTVANDGVELWINGQLLISAWTTNAATQTNSATIRLNAQQLYNIQLKYFQSTGNAGVQLLWSSPSTALAVIPTTQLYPYTNPPPAVVLSAPTSGASFTAAASVSLTAEADAQYNPLSYVSFYTNGVFIATLSNAPYALTATGWPAGHYTLTATATDGSGLTSTSAPVNITVTPASGLPYGLTTAPVAPAFYNMPATFTGGPIPMLLSQTGVFSNTPAMLPVGGLIPYAPNAPLWSDSALKIRYMSVPNNGALDTPSQQIGFAATGGWTFPAGTVFVKTFELQTNLSDTNSIHRLETRLLMRDTNGAVYGVTYKWLPDNSDAVLLSNSLTEAITITNNGTSYVQNWYYPSPADCLTCHTKVDSYVLGLNTRQLNGNLTYPTGVADNQLRTLNRLGLFYPAFDEGSVSNFEQEASITNQSAPLTQRVRSYLDANCAMCHQPGGTGITLDARYDTPLTNQNIINTMAAFTLGYDNAKIVAPSDEWRSVMYDRLDTVNPATKMPPLDRMTIDTNAVAVLAEWINSLGGTPALPPPVLAPAAGTFTNGVTLTLQEANTNAAIYYTLDGSLPTTNSILYEGPFNLTGSATVTANAFETNYVNSVVVSGVFTIVPPLYSVFAPGFEANGSFAMQYWAPAGQTYILQTSPDLINWTAVSTNLPTSAPFTLVDSTANTASVRYYRVVTP